MEEQDRKQGAEPQATEPHKNGVTRRRFVQTTGTGLAVAAGTGLGLFGGKPPAKGQRRTMHVLDWSSFVGPADTEVDRQAEEFGKMEGIDVRVEHVSNNNLQPRAASAVESETGPDIIQLFNNLPKLYAGGLIDHAEIIEDVYGSADNVYPVWTEASEMPDGKHVGMPYFATSAAFAYRRDIFDQVGVTAFRTWDQALEDGRKLKEFGYPVGQALAHSFGDPPGFAYSVLWAFGGSMIDEDANVSIDSAETRQAIEFVKEFWVAACDEGGTGWDDGSNNRAFFAETISTTRNGASIYFVAKRNWDEDQDPFVWRLHHFLDPEGPAGSRHSMTTYHRCIFQHSPVQTAARNYLRYIAQDEQFDQLMRVNNGYIHGPVPKWGEHPLWTADPALTPFQTAPETAVTYGFPGPYDRRVSEAISRYIVVDMFARAVKGDSADEVINWARRELGQIYG